MYATFNTATKHTTPLSAEGMHARSTPFFQPKLTVNTPGDAHEQEADAVADQVMRMREGDTPVVQRKSITPVVQRACAHCDADKEKEGVQRKETGGNDASGKSAPSIVSDVLSSGGGQAMDGGTQQFMESRFGQDFSSVRIHTGAQAAESASAIQARAYTSGRDVVFGAGEYQPGTDSGKRLLAHELTHVGQQGEGVRCTPDANASPTLSEPERIELRRITGDNISMAYTDFSTAAQRVKASIKSEAQANLDFTWLLLDIALGFLMPGIGRAIKTLANNIPVNASNAAYRVALFAIDESKTKQVITSITSLAKYQTKKDVLSLYGETEVDSFIDALIFETRKAFTSINKDLPIRTDEELGILYVSFSPEMVNVNTYAAEIEERAKQYRSEVEPIGTKERGSIPDDLDPIQTTDEIKLGLIRFDKNKYYCLINYSKWVSRRGWSNSNSQWFVKFVSKDMKSFAISKAGSGALPEFDYKDIDFDVSKMNLPVDKIASYP